MGLPERSCIRHREASLQREDLDLAIKWDDLLGKLEDGESPRLLVMRQMCLLLAEEQRVDKTV